jgi:hypothetical protein
MLPILLLWSQWLASLREDLSPVSDKKIPNERFVQEYAEGSAKLVELYNDCLIQFEVEETTVPAGTRWSGTWSGTYYAKQGKCRLDKIGWGSGNTDQFYLALPSWPFSLRAVRHPQQGWLNVVMGDADYEIQRLNIQIQAWPLLEVFSVNYTPLSQFLASPLILEYSVTETDDGGKLLIRVDFTDNLVPRGSGSVWLDPRACWAIVRGEWSTRPQGVNQGNRGRRWEITYRVGEDTIPYVEAINIELWSDGDQIEPPWRSRLILRVTKFSRDPPDHVFSATALGFSGWAALKVYWKYYRLNIACFIIITIIVIFSYIVFEYRRWRRRRAWQTPSQLAQ